MAGQKPFAELRLELQVLAARYQGHTLNHPGHCSAQLFDLIRECWVLDPLQRPTMDDLPKKVKRLALKGVLWRPQALIAHSSSPAPATLSTMQMCRYPLLGKQRSPEYYNGSSITPASSYGDDWVDQSATTRKGVGGWASFWNKMFDLVRDVVESDSARLSLPFVLQRNKRMDFRRRKV
jgi:hypothetical protein